MHGIATGAVVAGTAVEQRKLGEFVVAGDVVGSGSASSQVLLVSANAVALPLVVGTASGGAGAMLSAQLPPWQRP